LHAQATRSAASEGGIIVEPISAIAGLPPPNPQFGYRSHFSVDGGKSGFVVVKSPCKFALFLSGPFQTSPFHPSSMRLHDDSFVQLKK
jgi:hypothetical protein